MRYYPDKTGTAPLVTQLCQDLVRKGVEVTVITSLPHYGRKSIHPDYREYEGLFNRSVEDDVELIRTPIFVPKNGGIIPRAVNYLSYNFFSILAGFFVEKPDLVLAINPPITTAFVARFIGFLRGIPILVGIQDVWPDCVVIVGKLRNRLLIRFSKVLEKLQYRLAKKIIVLSPGMRRNLELKGVDPAKIEVIANWADTSAIQPVNKINDFYQQHELEGKFIVLFSGNHGYISSLETVVHAASILENQEDILFILAGEGSVKADLIELAEQLDLRNVQFLTTQPEETWLEMLAACDLALVPLRRNLAGLNVPSKVYTLMAAGRPILASVPRESEVAELVLSAKSGIISVPEDPQNLAEKILELKEKPDVLQQFGQNGRDYLSNNYNRQQQTELYYRVLKSVLEKD